MFTREQIIAKRSPRGGYSKAALAELGLPWPPKKGFIARLTGEAPAPKISSALRYEVLKRDGGRCVLCGRTAKDGITLTIDHVLPKSVYRDLQIKADDLQTLCMPCNEGKALDETDWR